MAIAYDHHPNLLLKIVTRTFVSWWRNFNVSFPFQLVPQFRVSHRERRIHRLRRRLSSRSGR
jgi:hypothetical protein